MYTPKNTSGFTLVEMVLATTIFAIMSVIILSIYIQTTALSSRLKATRYLSETSREITEMIAEDVRTRGLTGAIIAASPHTYWNGSSDYTQSGTEILGIGDGTREYIYGVKTPTGIDPCDTLAQQETKTHCGLYLVKDKEYSAGYNLVDSFIPEESKKRVKITNLRFYISGDGLSTEKKVTLVCTLALMPRIGVPNMDSSQSTLTIQTTISERFFQEK